MCLGGGMHCPNASSFSLDYFVPVFAFVVLGLVSWVLCQERGWEERLRNDLFCVEWDVKLSVNQFWHTTARAGFFVPLSVLMFLSQHDVYINVLCIVVSRTPLFTFSLLFIVIISSTGNHDVCCSPLTAIHKEEASGFTASEVTNVDKHVFTILIFTYLFRLLLQRCIKLVAAMIA